MNESYFPDLATREVNFDGLVGPTHNYSGLAHGNMASALHQGLAANPREAALQGLAKMKTLHDAGFAQAVLPPHARPDIGALAALGFTGTPGEILSAAVAADPVLVGAVSSAAAMWTANAATITPSADTPDGRLHFTPANLQSSFHRALETPTTAAVLRAIFADKQYFAHHLALPATPAFGDEGAANHTRLCNAYDAAGVHLFVYGQAGFPSVDDVTPTHFRARQTREAGQAVARQHGLAAEQCVFAQQNPDAIDAGVFHNDVIAVGNGPVLFYHEAAFADEVGTLGALAERLLARGTTLCPVRISHQDLPLAAAVSSYLFNSQLLSRADGQMELMVPGECEADAAVHRTLDTVIANNDNPIAAWRVLDVKQSMQNGGGPACLRLRVVMNAAERAAVSARVILDDRLYDDLCAWVNTHYRTQLAIDDLADPALIGETREALDALTRLLELDTIYDFQYRSGREINGGSR